jgi:hypothetical protein
MVVAHHQQEMKDLSDVEYAMQLRYDERETNAEEDHQSLMDELKNKVRFYFNIAQTDMWLKFHILSMIMCT